MASIPDKLKINTAIDKHTKIVASPGHITSSNFMQFAVAFCTELVPKQKFNFSINTFHRLSPLTSPTMGRGRVNNRIFFVPYRTVFPMWNDFKAETKHTYSDGTTGFVNSVPTFTDSDFRTVFTGASFASIVVDGTADNTDFELVKSDGTSIFYRLTPRGRQAMKLVHSLGYAIDFNESHGDFTHDALPLLCAAKVYIDWYSNPQYAEDVRYTDLIKVFKYDRPDYDTVVGTTVLANIFNVLQFVNYNPDYFVSAWDNPTNPNNGSASSLVIQDIDNSSLDGVHKTQVAVNVNGVPGSDAQPVLTKYGTNGLGGTFANLSQYMLDTLKKVTDYVSRNRIAGSRAIDRFFARFGIVLDSDKMNRSYRLKDNQSSILFGDVTSTADTDGASLGDYAGKGVAWNDSSVEFSADEFGRFIVISTIIPEADYYQGQRRDTMRISRHDFFTPEFDQLGTQAISKRELYVPMHNELDIDPSGWDAEVFGFTPRYSDYKVFHSMLSGDYRLNSVNTGLDSWYMFRDVKNYVVDRIFPAHSIVFTEGYDAAQYNRIFQYTDDSVDQFKVHHQMQIVSYFPGSSLFDTYEFDEKGEKVEMSVGGTQVN